MLLNQHFLRVLLSIVVFQFVSAPLPAQISPTPQPTLMVATLDPADLKEFSDQPDRVKSLITAALALTKLNLAYKYGSSDPKNGGMDCSGTVYYLLNQQGLKDVPRDASEMYRWVWMESRFDAVVSSNPKTFELSRLKPGDLLFWSGTYRIDRDPPVTHVMIYLGTNRFSGRPVMVGASENRRYNQKSCSGVSVFDFTLPSAKPNAEQSDSPSRFLGYGSIPGLDKTVVAR